MWFDIRKFPFMGYEVHEYGNGFRYTIPELKNYYLSTMRDVEEYIKLKTVDISN